MGKSRIETAIGLNSQSLHYPLFIFHPSLFIVYAPIASYYLGTQPGGNLPDSARQDRCGFSPPECDL
jgi:hypothetical protein